MVRERIDLRPAKLSLIRAFEIGCEIGESPVWDADSQRLWLTDIPGRVILRLDPATGKCERFETKERVGCLALVEGAADRLIVAFESGVALYQPSSGRTDWLWRPEFLGSGRRFNDGRVDRRGRFWAGTMIEAPCDAESRTAYIVCIGAEGLPERRIEPLEVANGLCSSKDGRRLHFSDSRKRVMLSLDLEVADATPQVFARTPDGFPDGAVIAADGVLWTAVWGAGSLYTYEADGRRIAVHAVPAPQPTSIAFGGRDLSTLFVTTASRGLDPTRGDGAPTPGSVLMYETDTRGLPESAYRYSGER